MYNSSRGILYTAPPDEDGNRATDEPTEEATADEPDVTDITPATADADGTGPTAADD